MFHVFLMFIFGLIGYCVKKLDFPPAPIVLALILGPMVERAIYQSLTMSHGSLGILVTRPFSAAFLVLVLIVLAIPAIRWFREGKKA